jgi:hypothetical protein
LDDVAYIKQVINKAGKEDFRVPSASSQQNDKQPDSIQVAWRQLYKHFKISGTLMGCY